MTVLRAKIEMTIQRKRQLALSSHDKAMYKFFENVYDAIVKNINFNVVKVVLLASPGFLHEDFLKWIVAKALKNKNKELLVNKEKFVLVHSSSGFKHSLKEVLADESVVSKVKETKAFKEVRALDAFFQMMNTDPDRAFYGYDHVKKADDQKAIETLLISDQLFRCYYVVFL